MSRSRREASNHEEMRSGSGRGEGFKGFRGVEEVYLRDGSLATVRATILRASGWPAEEDGLIKEYGGKGRENNTIQTQTHMNLFSVKNREKDITSDKVEYEFKFILVEVRWGDN